MFGSTFYVMKVTKELFRLGWTPETLPSSMDPRFRGAIVELKNTGASPERAAALLSEALYGDEDACKLVAKSGPNAQAIFGSGYPLV